MVETPAKAGNAGLILRLGRSHMLRTAGPVSHNCGATAAEARAP